LETRHRETWQLLQSNQRMTVQHQVAVLYRSVMWMLETVLYSPSDASNRMKSLASAAVLLMDFTSGHKERSLKRAVHARHAEHRAMKEQLRAWYAMNRSSFSSVEAACDHAVTIVPVKESTARTWIREFRRHDSSH
jgi:hypothetical protein